LRLPAQSVGIAEVQSLHHCMDGRSNLCWVWVT
jgi:hypothetical protein